MKNFIKYILVINLIALWSFSYADEKITNGAKVKVKAGTHFIEKGSLKIENSSNLIIEGMLTVGNQITNNNEFAGLQIKSNALNTGSIIYEHGAPNARIERHMKSARPHYIGSPVIGETAATLDFNNLNTHLYNYIDGSGLSPINDNNTILVNGKGYYYRIYPNSNGSITPVYEGQLTSSSLELHNNSTPPLNYNSRGYNMLANPYACAIDWNDPYIEFSDMEASVWIYDANARRIKFQNNSGYGNLKDGIIPMGQGFMVRTYSTEASLTIPAQARRHNNQAFYKTSDEVLNDLNFLVFELVKDSLVDELWVGYQWNSGDGFDNGLDITKMFTFEEEPQIYTSHDNEDFSIDLIQEPGMNGKQLPMYIRAGTNGVHHLNLTEFQGFTDMNIELEDLVTGEFINVAEMHTYEFTSNVDDENLRFILHFNPALSIGTDNYANSTNQVQIYSYGDQIYIKSEGSYAIEPKKVYLYDLNARFLGEAALSKGHLNSLKNRYNRKMLIVKVKFPSVTFVDKIIFPQ